MRSIHIRKAAKADVPEIVRLLAEEPHAADRECYTVPLPDSYYQAFDAIHHDHNQLLLVAENEDHIFGTLQLTFIPNISFQGSWRALIEAVMVDNAFQGQGIGSRMIEWAVAEAKQRGCRFIQLTSNKKRNEAHRFYGRLGFTASHEGFKRDLGA